MIVPKDLFGNELKVGDLVVYSTSTSTRNSMLCHGNITRIEQKPESVWIYIVGKDDQLPWPYKKTYIYREDRKYCNICKVTNMTLIINEEDLKKGHKDPPGPQGDSYEDCLRKYWPDEYKKYKEQIT
jgi:hypothetical protein